MGLGGAAEIALGHAEIIGAVKFLALTEIVAGPEPNRAVSAEAGVADGSGIEPVVSAGGGSVAEASAIEPGSREPCEPNMSDSLLEVLQPASHRLSVAATSTRAI